MKILLSFIILTFFIIGCQETNTIIKLPLKKNLLWFYESQGYRSYKKYIGKRPDYKKNEIDYAKINDIEISLDELNETPLKKDTIEVFINNIENISDDSVLYEFNIDFIRFWGSKVIEKKDGYLRYLDDSSESTYFLKFPITLNNAWTNKHAKLTEHCKITNIDTTIVIDGRSFSNCIRVSINQIRELKENKIDIYFNNEFGIVYLIDNSGNDEIKLLRMEKR